MSMWQAYSNAGDTPTLRIEHPNKAIVPGQVDNCQMQNKLNYNNHPPATTSHAADKHLLVATKHSLIDHLQKIKTLDQLS